MRPLVRIPLSLAVLLAAPLLLAAAQDKEKEKKPAPGAKKVYTDDDLRAGRSSRGTLSVATPSETAAEAAGTATGAEEGARAAEEKKEPTAEELREQKRQELQAAVDEQVARIAELRQRMEAAQLELNDLGSLTFSSPDGAGRRPALMKLLEDSAREIREAESRIEELEDQARHAGVRVSRP